jgi:hypothetical protein
MWNINSNNVQRAKKELQLRRTEVETRYAEEQQALDAELAAIEALERAAAEFILRHAPENGATGSDAPDSGDAGGGESDGSGPEPCDPADRAEPEPGSQAVDSYPPAESATGESAAIAASLDILKPGSRWRLYRSGGRPSDPETGTEGPFPPAG